MINPDLFIKILATKEVPTQIWNITLSFPAKRMEAVENGRMVSV